jgi:integrase
MPKISLNDASLRSLKVDAGQADFWDQHLPSFGVRVSPTSKTFMVNIGNSRRSLGRYLPGVFGLADARTEAKRLLAERTLGKVAPSRLRYSDALQDFLAEKGKFRRANTVRTLKDRLSRHFSFTGQLGDFSHKEAARRLSKIKSNSEHDHALSAAKTFFTWCQSRRYIDDNPMRGLSTRGHTSRARVLTDDELKAVWIAADQCGQFGVIVKLLTATGQRRGEIAALQTSWLDLENKTLTIPASVAKNGREHMFPIASMALNILQGMSIKSATCNLLFPARGTSAPFNGWSKAKATLDDISGVSGWTLHDLRRTFATTLAELGCPIHIIERLLNHISGQISGVTAVYNRASYIDEMRQWITKYDAHLCGIVND